MGKVIISPPVPFSEGNTEKLITHFSYLSFNTCFLIKAHIDSPLSFRTFLVAFSYVGFYQEMVAAKKGMFNRSEL